MHFWVISYRGYSIQIGEDSEPLTHFNPPVSRDEDLDEPTVRRIEGLVERVSDEEMRRAVRDVLIKGAKLERHRSDG